MGEPYHITGNDNEELVHRLPVEHVVEGERNKGGLA